MFYSYGCNFATACFCRKSFKIAVEAAAGVVFARLLLWLWTISPNIW